MANKKNIPEDWYINKNAGVYQLPWAQHYIMPGRTFAPHLLPLATGQTGGTVTPSPAPAPTPTAGNVPTGTTVLPQAANTASAPVQPAPYSPAQSSSAQQYFGNLPGAYNPPPLPFGETPLPGPGYQPIETAKGNVLPYLPGGVAVSPTQMNFVDTKMPQLSPADQIKLESGFPGVGAFTFDFPAEQQKAYQSLKPFYDKLLGFAGGRLDLAKRILEYTYQQGMRESRQEYGQAAREQAITFPQEREQKLTAQNKRGILESGFGGTQRERLGESQNLRREAIQRALQNRESRLTSQRGFGLEEKQKGFGEERFGLERERRKEATGMTEKKFDIGREQWGAKLAAKSAEEARRIQKEQLEAMKKPQEVIYRWEGG